MGLTPKSPLTFNGKGLCVEKGVHNIILSSKLYASTSKLSLSQELRSEVVIVSFVRDKREWLRG